MATPPPTPPSPPEGDATPDGGNPAQTTPPEVAPKPGRQAAKETSVTKKPAARARRTPAAKPKSAKSTAAPKAAGKAPAAPRKPTKPRATTTRRADPRPRPRAAGLSVATAPAPKPVDTIATDPATRSRGHWWKTIAGGVGAVAAGAALFSLKGSSRRKAHQADGTDSSKSFEAGIADEGTIPDKPEE